MVMVLFPAGSITSNVGRLIFPHAETSITLISITVQIFASFLMAVLLVHGCRAWGSMMHKKKDLFSILFKEPSIARLRAHN
jgi:hypothetical protein